MGLNMVLRLKGKGYEIVSYNRSEEGRRRASREGVQSVDSLRELMTHLASPRLVWIMVSETGVDKVLDELLPLLSKNDTVIDGGNCFFQDTVRRARRLTRQKINFLDVGVSGGPKGARNGACLMIGGKKNDFKKYMQLFKDLSISHGYGYMGDHGAGHFVKMIHNGIEYGMMQALAEGFAVMKKSSYKLDLEEIARLYNRGSVVESSLVGWLFSAFQKFGKELKDVSGTVAHTGEGEWTVKTAKKLGVSAKVIEDAFNFRVASGKQPSYTGRILSALRNQFGGHAIKNSKIKNQSVKLQKIF